MYFKREIGKKQRNETEQNKTKTNKTAKQNNETKLGKIKQKTKNKHKYNNSKQKKQRRAFVFCRDYSQTQRTPDKKGPLLRLSLHFVFFQLVSTRRREELNI